MPQGLITSADIFQNIIDNLCRDLEHVRSFIDETLVTGKSIFKKHVLQVNEVLSRMRTVALQVSTKKSSWGVKEVKFAGHVLKKNGHEPDLKKIIGLIRIKRLKTKQLSRRFIRGINFCRKMWRKRAHMLALLTKLTGKVPFKWGEKQDELMLLIAVTKQCNQFPRLDHSAQSTFQT